MLIVVTAVLLGLFTPLYFTLMLVLVYAVALGRMFAASSGKIAAFPDVDASMVALMGISHAGHLTAQAT